MVLEGVKKARRQHYLPSPRSPLDFFFLRAWNRIRTMQYFVPPTCLDTWQQPVYKCRAKLIRARGDILLRHFFNKHWCIWRLSEEISRF